MRLIPSTREVEATGRVLLGFQQRAITSWTDARLAAALRPLGISNIDGLVDLLLRAGVAECTPEREWRLTDVGAEVVEHLAAGRWGPLGAAALCSGAYEEEVVRLLGAGAVEDSVLRCPLSRLPRLAPVAGAFLAWDATNREGDVLAIEVEVLQSALTHAAMEQSYELPGWVEDQQGVGWRAELYSVRYERTRVGPMHVRHVSRDVGDRFGYDIETTAGDPAVLIEVKGSRSSRLSFFLSARELEVAQTHPDRYRIHFWGEISLDRDPWDEYAHLTASGYPVTIDDVPTTIESPEWSVTPKSWRITGPAGLLPQGCQ